MIILTSRWSYTIILLPRKTWTSTAKIPNRCAARQCQVCRNIFKNENDFVEPAVYD